ncbi:hypothetical protein [Novipirellula sp.]|uniref:hypothetical protein n=1 Tax=Novipirellula sp. TaxID=2795430 RepID=UPI003568FD23
MVEIQGEFSASPGSESLPRNPDQVALGTDSVDSETITRDAISRGDLYSDAAVAAPPSPAEPFLGSESVPPSQIADTAMPMPPEGWQSDRTRKSRQVGMIVAVSIATVLIAMVVFVWFVRTWNRGAASADAASPVTTSDAANAPAANDVAAVNTIAPEVEAFDPSAPPPVPSAASPSPPVRDPSDNDSSDNDPSDNAVPSPEGNPSAVDSSEIDGNPVDAEPMPAEIASVASPKKSSNDIPTDLLPVDPLGPIVDVNRDAAAPVADDGMSKLDEIPPELRKFTVLLDLGRETNETKPTIQTPPTLDKLKVENAAEETLDPMMIATPPAAINLDRALALKFAMNSKGYPLGDLVLLFSQLSGVPIQIDWMSLDMAQISIRERVATARGFLSAREHLEQLGTSIGATIEFDQSFAMITMEETEFAKRVEPVLQLDDFGDDRAAAISVLGKFLQNDAEAQPGTVKIGKALAEQQLAVLAFESLRRMRGLEGKLQDQFLNRWAHVADSTTGPWPVLAAGDPGPTLDAPITIAELLRRVSRKNQATCMVNWFDARRRRLSPEQLVMPYVKDDAGKMLSTLLQPFEMQVRRVDDSLWWVGTEATYDRLLLVVWSEPLGDQRDAFIQRVSEVMAARAEAGGRITYDAVSDRVMMLLPRYIVRQLSKIQS